ADAVNIERPIQLPAGDPRYGSYGGASYTGRLALREWSLVVRGQPEKIEGVIITSDQWLLYKANPDSFGRFFSIELKSNGDSPTWMVGRKPLTADQLPMLAKQLHSALTRAVKKGKATATFRFSTGKTTAVDAVTIPVETPSNGLPQRPR